MNRIKQCVCFLVTLLLCMNACVNAQSITGDTIYVDSKTVIAVRFPSLPSNFYTSPPDAPYNLISLPTGFTIIAKKKNTKSASLTITESKRIHNFIIVYKKNINPGNLAETDYDFSTIKKLKDHVKYLEDRETNYNAAIKAADNFFQIEDFANAKIFYTQALGLINRPWPKEQILKVNKKLKKAKRKK